MSALRTMSDIARKWEVDDIVVLATSAVREAPNRSDFIRAARRKAGVIVRVISGDEEADYIYRAIRAALDFQGGTAFCADIGGGSVELIVGTAEEVFFTWSEPVGSLRLTQRFLTSDPPTSGQLLACRTYVRSRLKKPLDEVRALGFDLPCGTSGTIVTLANLASGQVPAEEDPAFGLRWIPREGLEDLIKRMMAMKISERVKAFGLDPKRAETIIGGAVVLSEIFRALRLERLLASDAALREGIVEKLLEQRNAKAPRDRSVRRTSVLELAERSDYDRGHATHVARLATRLFDQLQDLHELPPSDRELLEYASLLHEIGTHVSFQRHHKHSYYLIRHAGLRGFTDDQIAIIANVARYYRKTPPHPEHQNLSSLTGGQRDTVARLAAIVRIADGLDRGRRQVVRDVGVTVGDKRVRFEIRQRGDAEIELESARKRSSYFAHLFGRKVTFEFLPDS